MEYRAQTYLGTLQLVAVVAGCLFLQVAVKVMEDRLAMPGMGDPLRFHRMLAEYGWMLAVVPMVWVILTIRGERSEKRWAGRGMTVGSGVVLLIGFAGLFGWVALITCRPFG